MFIFLFYDPTIRTLAGLKQNKGTIHAFDLRFTTATYQ